MSEQAENRAERGARRRIGAAFLLASFAAIPLSSQALAQASPTAGTSYLHALASLERHEVASLALTLGVLVFAVVVSIAYLQTRVRASSALDQAQGEIARLKDELDRANAIILSEPQVIVAWRETSAEPLILGDAAGLTGQPAVRRLLAFGTWLEPGAAREMEAALDSLRRRGEAFGRVLRTRDSRHVEIEGRPIAGAAVLRLRELTGARLDHAALADSFSRLEAEVQEMRALLSAVPAPIWIRDAEGRLIFANRAYALAVEARDADDAIARGLELLDRSAREEALRARAEGRTFAKRLPAVVAGQRRMLDVVEVSGARGAAGVGIDATEAETIRAELTRVVAAHRRTLDQLATAVAIFGADERLVFYNAAYRALFQLDPAFLDERPTDSTILDRLRTERRLPEQADYRAWKAQLLDAYRAVEPKEHRWYLPGGRTLRVVTNPNPEHGVTYLFDDISERIELESRFNALNRTQSETLEALTEAVAVFGTDGRLKLHNPVFAQMWKLSPQTLATRPHIDTVAGWARMLLGRRLGGEEALGAIKLAVTALEHRTPVERRIERVDGSVLDCAALPLPDGDTLVTFRDVSDSVNVERALVERNEALIAADALKSAFVHHVSYELRSPLTTIIGFAQLLDDPVIGPLNTKQREYVGHITESSAALLGHHQRYSGSRHYRRRCDAARALRRRCARNDAGGGRRHPRPAGRAEPEARYPGAARYRRPSRRCQARTADSVQSSFQRRRFFAARRDDYACSRAARRRGHLPRRRQGTRRAAGTHGARVRPLRDAHAGLQASRPGTWALDRALIRGIARRQRRDRQCARRRRDRDLHLPACGRGRP